MPYCIELDITNAKDSEIISQLTGKTGSIVSAIVDAAIEYADGEIDGALNGRYIVPLTGTIPEVIVNYSIQLSICYLYRRRHSTPEDVKLECDQVKKELEEIRTGERTIPGLSSSDMVVVQPFEADDLGGYTENKFDMNTLE